MEHALPEFSFAEFHGAMWHLHLDGALRAAGNQLWRRRNLVRKAITSGLIDQVPGKNGRIVLVQAPIYCVPASQEIS